MEQEIDRITNYRIQRVKRDANYNYQCSHYHPYYEIGYLASGTRCMTVDHSLYHMQKGDLIFISSKQLHKGFPEEHHPVAVEWINLYFTEEYLAPFIPLISKAGSKELFHDHIISLPASLITYVENLFQRMIIEYNGIDELSELAFLTYFRELITLLIREKRKAPVSVSTAGLDKNDEWAKDAVRYLYYHYSDELTLEEVASRYGMSKSYFSKRFKLLTGFGYKEYLTNVRLKEASHLLLTTDKNITEIALACGFSDSNYFGDAFRKANGVSPHKYRRYNQLKE